MMKSFKTFLLMAGFLISAATLNSAVAATPTPEAVFKLVAAETAKVFGAQRADLYVNDVSIKDTALLFLELNTGLSTLDNGYVLLEGCRVHSCIEKAATIVDLKTKRILALALLNFNCRLTILKQDDIAEGDAGKRNAQKHECESQARLDLFLVRKKSHLIDEAKLVETLQDWGKKFGYASEHVRIIVRP